MAGTTYADDMDFDETRDFGAGQTFGDNTQFSDGQTFDDDVNFSGSNIQFGGSTFENTETFGAGADFYGTQIIYGNITRLVLKQHLPETQNFGAGHTELWRRNIFRRKFQLCSRSRVCRRYSVCIWIKTFDLRDDDGEFVDYNFESAGIDFGVNTNFGQARDIRWHCKLYCGYKHVCRN